MRGGNDVYFIFRKTNNGAQPLTAGTECIGKALNGTELVPEYYLELVTPCVETEPLVTVESVSESRLTPHNPS